MWVQSVGQEDPLEEGMTTHSSILSCLENSTDRGDWWATAMGSQRVRHDCSDLACMHACWGALSHCQDKGPVGASLWAAPERAHLEDQAHKGHWGFSGYFSNLMDLHDPWGQPVAPSWVPDPHSPLQTMPHEVVSKGALSTAPPTPQHTHRLTRVYTHSHPRHRCPQDRSLPRHSQICTYTDSQATLLPRKHTHTHTCLCQQLRPLSPSPRAA